MNAQIQTKSIAEQDFKTSMIKVQSHLERGNWRLSLAIDILLDYLLTLDENNKGNDDDIQEPQMTMILKNQDGNELLV